MRAKSNPIIVTAMTTAALMSALSACTTIPGYPDDLITSPTTSVQSAHVWKSDGYSWIIVADGNTAQTFETTQISCLPSHTLDQEGAPAADGTVEYGTDGIAAETLRPGPNGTATLHLLGSAADVDLLPLPSLPTNCTKRQSDDPLTTFDVFWATFAENYNSFQHKKIDWAAVRDKYRPMVNADTDDEQLYAIFQAMLEPLGDAHTSVEDGHNDVFSGKRPGTRDKDDLSLDTVNNSIDQHLRQDLGVATIRSFARGLIAYADLPNGYGYLRINAFEGYGSATSQSGDNTGKNGGDDFAGSTRHDQRSGDHRRHRSSESSDSSDTADGNHTGDKATLDEALTSIFTAQRVRAWRGLTIDVRYNTGGDDALGLDVASRLTDVSYTAYSKQARNDPNDPSKHARLQTVTVTPADGPRYTGPVRVLTSDETVSAGETFVEATMGRAPQAARIGSNTQGVFADDMDRSLPNGWIAGLGNEDYYGPDGTNYESTGIPPTIPVPVFTPDDLAQHRDPAIDTPW